MQLFYTVTYDQDHDEYYVDVFTREGITQQEYVSQRKETAIKLARGAYPTARHIRLLPEHE